MGDQVKIISLEAENFKRLKAVRIVPAENGLTIIGGDNAQGKSSILDAIMSALGGGRLTPEKPIRDGEKKAFCEIELSNGLKVKRTFTPGGGAITVTGVDGTAYKSPQKILDDLFGELGFDPLAFIRLDEKKQADLLKSACGLDADFNRLDAEREKAYQERTLVNRDLKKAQGALDKAEKFPDAGAEVVSLSDLSNRLEDAMRQERNFANKSRALQTERNEIAAMDAEIELLHERKKMLVSDVECLAKEVNDFVVPDIDGIKNQIRGIEETNRKVRANIQRAELETETKALKRKADDLSKAIDKAGDEKERLLKEAKLPLNGIAIGENGLIYQGIPLKQASSAEQIQLSIALADVLQPKSRVILIREGSNLDAGMLRQVAEMSEARGLQVLMERVSKGAECAVVIEDGEVKE